MEGFASPGDGAGMVEAAGEPAIGANLADEAEASLLRPASLLRDDMVLIKLAWSRGCWRWTARCGATAEHAGDEIAVLDTSMRNAIYWQWLFPRLQDAYALLARHLESLAAVAGGAEPGRANCCRRGRLHY